MKEVELAMRVQRKLSVIETIQEFLRFKKRVVLVGKAGSGKDYARKLLTDKGYSYGISYTSRPPRIGEVDGVDYFFLSEEKFQEMINDNQFYEHVSFNNWYYGTSVEQIHTQDVFIMTPHGVSKLKPEDRKESLVVYFNIDENTRRERISLRSDADKVVRRISADREDFKEFDDFDYCVNDAAFS